MVAFFPTNPGLNISGTNPSRRSSNPLERAREIQKSSGQLGTLGFGGIDDSPHSEMGDIFDNATRSIFDSAAASPTRAIDAAQNAREVTKFPDNIDSYENFMKIIVLKERIFETAIGKASRNKTTRSAISTLKLPLPSQLATTYAQGYKQEGIGPIGVAGIDPALKLFDRFKSGDIKGLGSLSEELGKTANSVKDNLGADGAASIGIGLTDEAAGILAAAAGGGLLGGIVGEGAGQVVKGALGSVGLARNPHMAVLYEAPNFREFNFSWDLRPKTPRESDNIRLIIKKLKYHSAPSTRAQDHLFTYPEQFAISFKRDEYLFKTRNCVLTGVSVDYHGEGTPLYYDRGGSGGNKAPAAIKLDLTFTETRVLQKADINAGM